MTKLPQFSASMEFDELAYENLRQFFAKGKYAFSEVRTVLGSREFGKDWVIEKLDANRANTGIEFFVQSKTTSEVEKDGYISFEFETKNINYLAAKTVPVFIHLLQREQSTGYMIDFQEWYNTNYSEKWLREQQTVTVKIPVEQKLSDELVNEITKQVSDENYRARIRRAADLFNVRNPDFRASSPEFFENDVITIMEPKHENVSFEITVNALGNEAIRKAHEEGYAVSFPIVEDTSPSPFESVTDHSGKKIVTLFPYLPSETYKMDIVLFDKEGKVLEEFLSVVFHVVRPGSVERELHGQPENLSTVFSITTRHNEVQSNILNATIGFFCLQPDNYVAVQKYFELYDKWRIGAKVLLLGSANKNKIYEFELSETPPIDETIRRFINAAHNLDQKHNIHIPMPAEAEINDELLCYTELANDIKSSGKSHWVIITKPVIRKVNIKDAKKIVEHFKLNQFVLLAEQNPNSIELGIRGVKIDLGMLRTVLHVTKISNLREIEKYISDQNNEDAMITIEAEIDEEKSFTVQIANPSESITEE